MDIKKIMENCDSGKDVLDAMAFMQGQMHCIQGIPHVDGKGDDYDRGYAAQYELEQILGEMTK
jgi:hypothetical protein